MSTSVCAAVSLAAGMAANESGWDSDGSLSWEDFFGTSTDLMPTLLGMYDSLIGRPGAAPGAVPGAVSAAAGGSPRPPRARAPPPPPPHRPPRALQPSSPRPLSVSSIASSSSSASSSGASSSSAGGGGGAGGLGLGAAGGGAGGGAGAASCAYLASIESLDDASDDDEGGGGGASRRQRERDRDGRCSRGATGSQGSGDSGRCSPGRGGGGGGGGAGAGAGALPYAQRVVAEVLESERFYVRDLRQVVEGYLHFWRSQSDCPLSDQQLADLFSNLEEIYEFNSTFLEQLEQCGLDPVRVARCFVRHNAGFCIYTQYCTNYPRTVSVLTGLMRVEAAARLFRERQTALAHALPLGSFLLKPVQRILKYHLLLQNIVKHLEPDADGRADVVDALSTMTGIAHHINSMKRRHEHAVRVQEIQSLLYGWEGEDLTTFGELCAEGAFRLAGAKALRHAFLFDRMLLITKKKEEGVLSYKAHILCSNLMLIESVPGEPLSFHVIPFDNPRLQYTLRARNLEQKREWALQLKRVILENYNAVIPSHARRLVMELGQNRTDDEILADKTPPRRQHSAPEYLEKRKQERERRKSETGLRHRLRRQRKSDTGLSTGESPSSPRRHRRASSSSRERSQSRDGLRSVSPAAIKERFGSWRRKSEPGCYSSDSKSDGSPQLTLLPERSSSPAALQSPIETPSSEKAPPVISDILQSPSSSPASSAGTSLRDVPASANCNGCPDGSKPSSNGQRSLEEIVGQLLLQNHEFQKMLQRQQRRQQLRTHHRSVSNPHTAETSDAETEADDGAYESLTLPITLTPPPKSKSEQILQGDEEQESDYVTLTVPNGGSVGSVGSRRSGDYDNLQQIWESVRRQQEEIHRLAEREGVGERDCERKEERENNSLQAKSMLTPSLRRAQSFCASVVASPSRSSTSSASNTAASLEALDSMPTAPAVWLRQQGAHLATPSKKSGSLPRSFQLTRGFGSAAAILACTGRPFTIASDPPSEINFEDIERYMAQASVNGSGARHAFPLAPTSPATATGDTTEDESIPEATTPAASLRELNVHPEHKIYRPATARSALRQVVVNVSARLAAGLRASSEALDDTSNEISQQNTSGNVNTDSRRVSRRIMSAFRHYSKTRLRLNSHVGEESVATDTAPSPVIHRSPPPPMPPPPPPTMVGAQQLPIYKQGSSRLGARIALCSSEYANPQQLLSHLPSRNPDARPDSVLSASSAFTSSSDGERPPQLPPESSPEAPLSSSANGTREDLPMSDGSADSYYERSFEAIENLLENDAFRDSAVFSDHEDNDSSEMAVNVNKYSSRKVPPPIPAKPDTLKCRFIHIAVPSQADVKEKSRVLAETAALTFAARNSNGGKYPTNESNGDSRSHNQRPTQLSNHENQRRRDDDWESESQHSAASTVVEVVPTPQHFLSDDENNAMQQKGWVKHVIGKLQGPSNGETVMCKKMTTFPEVGDSG